VSVVQQLLARIERNASPATLWCCAAIMFGSRSIVIFAWGRPTLQPHCTVVGPHNHHYCGPLGREPPALCWSCSIVHCAGLLGGLLSCRVHASACLQDGPAGPHGVPNLVINSTFQDCELVHASRHQLAAKGVTVSD
jgi:hypothetical protein